MTHMIQQHQWATPKINKHYVLQNVDKKWYFVVGRDLLPECDQLQFATAYKHESMTLEPHWWPVDHNKTEPKALIQLVQLTKTNTNSTEKHLPSLKFMMVYTHMKKSLDGWLGVEQMDHLQVKIVCKKTSF